VIDALDVNESPGTLLRLVNAGFAGQILKRLSAVIEQLNAWTASTHASASTSACSS